MIAELNDAKGVLEAALDRYYTILSTIVNSCDPDTLSQEVHYLISPEVEAITAYEAKLKRSKAIASRIRNSNRSIAPINALPSDILTQIFEILVDTQPRYCSALDDRKNTLGIIFRLPDVLTRVCTRWRRVAIDSPSLWASIALAPLDKTRAPYTREHDLRSYAMMLVNRANLFLSRAGQFPLDIYFEGESFPHEETTAGLTALGKAVAPRARRLEFGALTFRRLDFLVFRGFMRNCTPGTLRQLVIFGGNCVRGDSSHFIDGVAEPMDTCRWLFDIPQQTLEELLLPIDVMHLKGRYFRWESLAYHGLAELRLVTGYKCSHGTVSMNLTDIAKILAASPRLRLLHFGLRIKEPHVPCQPAPLQELEVLNLWPMDANECKIILRLIAPGPKPLQVLFKIPSRDDFHAPLFSRDYSEFFSRSNIVELKIGQERNLDTHRLPKLLGALPLPGLRVLALDQFPLGFNLGFYHRQEYPPITAFACSRLNILQFSYCAIDMYDLEWVAEVFPISQIQVSGGTLISAGVGEMNGTEDVQNELVKTFPAIYSKPVASELLEKRWDRWTVFD